MVFAYRNYFFHCFSLPLVLVILSSLIILLSIVSLILGIRTKDISGEKVAGVLLVVSICLFFVKYGAGIIYNGGACLLNEDERAAKTLEGVIEEVAPNDEFSFPNIKVYHHEYGTSSTAYIYGCKIKVKNEVLLVPEIGTLQSGENVSIVFLPESKYVLAITTLESE